MTSKKKFKRLESVRGLVHDMLPTLESNAMKQEAWVHLSGVSTFASMLALKRGLDSEIAAIAGLLHDFYFYKTGLIDFRGPNSADAVRPIIRGTQIFTDEELIIILRSIFYQEDIQRVHGPYDEIIKDAILLQMYFQDAGNDLSEADIHRLRNVFVELGIPKEHVEAESKSTIDMGTINHTVQDRRLMLADFAEILAGQNIIGIQEDERFREICKYWPDSDIYKVLEGKCICILLLYAGRNFIANSISEQYLSPSRGWCMVRLGLTA